MLVAPVIMSKLWSRGEGGASRTWGAAGYGLAALAFFAASRLEPPDLGSSLLESLSPILRLAALAALLASALAAGALPVVKRSGAPATPTALLFSVIAIAAGLALVSGSPAFTMAIAATAFVGYELWRRAVAESLPDKSPTAARLVAGAGLLLVLVVSPWAEHRRARDAFRVARAIRLPDPARASLNAAFTAQLAVDHVAGFRLDRELPAPLDEVNLSDLAYRVWRSGERRFHQPGLISYEVFDSAGRFRSSFSLLPEQERDAAGAEPLRIDRHAVAVVRRTSALDHAGVPWGSVRIDVADWPAWDSLPPAIEVYRRLVLGDAFAGAPRKSRRVRS